MLSIIIPLYNAENYVAQALDSVFAQKNVNIEVIVVDDGSVDNSAAIVAKYPVKYFKIKNSGASAARNYGLDSATGDYVMFLDADDFITDTCICQQCIEEIEKYKLDFAMFTYQYYNEITNKYGISINYPEIKQNDVERLTTELVKHGIFPASPCFKVLKRDFIERNNIRFIEGTTSEDIEWFTHLLVSTKKYRILNNNAYKYRKGLNTSVTGSSFSLKKCRNFLSMLKYSCQHANLCGSKELRFSILSALNYEFYILLANSGPHIKNKDIFNDFVSLRYLNQYTLFPHTSLLCKIIRVIGITNTSRLLSFYLRYCAKSSVNK